MHRDGAAVPLGEMAHERKAQPEAAAGASHRRLAKSLEHERQELALDPLPRIADADLELGAGGAGDDAHPATGRRELDGVRQQVPHDLLQAIGIPAQTQVRLDGAVDRDALRLGSIAHGVDRPVDDGRKLDRAKLQTKLAGDDARDVQEVLDQLRLQPGVAVDHLEPARDGIAADSAGAKHARPAQDRGEGRA